MDASTKVDGISESGSSESRGSSESGSSESRGSSGSRGEQQDVEEPPASSHVLRKDIEEQPEGRGVEEALGSAQHASEDCVVNARGGADDARKGESA